MLLGYWIGVLERYAMSREEQSSMTFSEVEQELSSSSGSEFHIIDHSTWLATIVLWEGRAPMLSCLGWSLLELGLDPFSSGWRPCGLELKHLCSSTGSKFIFDFAWVAYIELFELGRNLNSIRWAEQRNGTFLYTWFGITLLYVHLWRPSLNNKYMVFLIEQLSYLSFFSQF